MLQNCTCTARVKLILVLKVNGDLWDLDRPFEKDSTLELLDFESEEGSFLSPELLVRSIADQCSR